MTIAAGTQLGSYKILSPLGAGGMGEVWMAEDTRLKRKVALKLLPAELTADADRVRRFEQEAQAASALSHPNIITIHDIGESETGRFIVMELVAGRTLRELIGTDNTLETVLALGQQMAKALSAAHAAGITHRDIKPDNIMVREDGYVKVLDFGLAHLRPATESDSEAATLAQQTTPGTVMGTVAYMSPEQARGEAVSHPSDVFALGIVLYELATGRHPFKAETMVGYLHAITLQTPAPPQQWQPSLPTALNDLLLRMLYKEASQRPTASEVAQQLQAIERHREQRIEHKSEDQTLMLPAQSPALARPMPLRHTVGREPERNDLRTAFAQASAGRGSLLCVAGEPGIGKTTLVEDFLAELAIEGQCTMARGRCSERLAGTEAYLPLLEALESLLESHKSLVPTMKQVAPTWYAQVVPLSGDSDESARLLAEVKAASQERMKRELANFLQAVAERQPLVIFFDDLHWADVSTIDLLSFLAGKFDALRVLIVVTYRPSDMLLAKHPFLQIKPDLQARGLCRELSLGFLTEAEIADYLTLEFPRHAFPRDFAKLIHAKTEGSPLFMADLVRYLCDRGVIAKSGADFSLRSRRMDFSPSESENARTEVHDTSSQTEVCATWKLEQTLPDIERELPESVRGMIERKIAQLSEEDRKLLTAASVQGYEFDSAVVAQVLKLDADEVEERLEKLERVFAFVKLVSEAEFPNRMLTLKYRFLHVLYQNALYASLRATRKATLSREVAQTMEGFYGEQRTSVANELAALYEAGREYARAAEYYRLAAEHDTRVFAYQEAVALARRGLELLKSEPDTTGRTRHELALQITLSVPLGACRGLASQESRELFTRARELAQQLGDPPELLTIMYGQWRSYLIGGDNNTALKLGEEFLALARAKAPAAMVRAHQIMASVFKYRGEFTSAYTQTKELLAIWNLQPHDGEAVVVAAENPAMIGLFIGAWSLWNLGYPDQALQQSREALALARQDASPYGLALATFMAAELHISRREHQRVGEMGEDCLAICAEHGFPQWLANGYICRGWALVEAGQGAAGVAQMREGITAMHAIGADLQRSRYLALLGEACGAAGQLAEGLSLLAEALAFAEQSGERFFEAEIYRIRGELLLKSEASQAAVEECFHRAIQVAQRQQAKSLELRAVMSLARLWQRQDKITEAQQKLTEIYGWFTEGFDTADLQEAKALLEKISSESRLQAADSGSEEIRLKSELKTAGLKTPSIAVLPFINISNEPDNEYFCDGLAEELIGALSKIETLRVAARTSAFSFKGKEIDIREIGQKLNVGAVLEGSVRKAGNRLRITAQLVNVADGYRLWSEKYDRELKDIFDIQDEISLAIVEALKVKLLGAEKAAVLNRYNESAEAYQLYLKGRFFWNKRTDETLKQAITCFQQAIDLDPNYALAWAGLADAWFYRGYAFGQANPSEAMPKAKAAVKRALALDDTLAEAHISQGMIHLFYEWDWAQAENDIKRGIELNPSYPVGHHFKAIYLAAVREQFDEAIAEARRALALDPLSLPLHNIVALLLLDAHRYDEAIATWQKMLEMDPRMAGAWNEIGWAYELQGKFEEAVEAYAQAMIASGEKETQIAAFRQLFAEAGIKGIREWKLNFFLNKWEERHHWHGDAYSIAINYARLDDQQQALAWLETAFEARSGLLVWLKIQPAFDRLRNHPQFVDLLRRIGLPQ